MSRLATDRRGRRVARLGGAALVAGLAVAAFAASGAARLVPNGAPPQAVPTALQLPAPAAGGAQTAAGESEIEIRLDRGTGLMVEGERLHPALLRRFYAAHDWQPVWPSHPMQAAALARAVMAATDEGLDPDLFHAALLRNPAALSPIDRELVLSDAVLAYADALARGAIAPEDRSRDEDLTAGPVDVAVVLDRALVSPDPAAIITALAPHSPAYRALLRALRKSLRAPAGRRIAQQRRALEVNLERLRWLPRPLPADRVWVNAARARLVLYRGDMPIFTTRVIVGERDKQTPEFATMINGVLFNPPWNVPPSIATKEILPKLSGHPGYLAEHDMLWRKPGALQQRAGPHSALGRLKFEMTDRFDVYLHDTPERFLFAQRDRRRSHGCVRVEDPRVLAALLLDEPVAEISREIDRDATHRRPLKLPMPVFIVYQTVVAGPGGRIDVVPDVYGRDAEIWRHLHPAVQAPIAEHEAPTQRGG